MSNLPVRLNEPVRMLDLRPMARQANILGPLQVFAADGVHARATLLYLSPVPDEGDVYPSPSGGGRLALTKKGLLQIASHRGVVWDARESGKVDDAPPCNACVEAGRPRCPHNVGFKAVGAWLDPAGQWEIHVATRYWCYDEEHAEVERTYRKQLDQGRIKQADFEAKVRDEFNKRLKDRLSLTETKAKLRVVREAGIKAAYSPDELKLPFLIVRVDADLTPDQIRQRAAASPAQIFGPSSAPQPALPAPDWSRATDLPDDPDDDPEPRADGAASSQEHIDPRTGEVTEPAPAGESDNPFAPQDLAAWRREGLRVLMTAWPNPNDDLKFDQQAAGEWLQAQGLGTNFGALSIEQWQTILPALRELAAKGGGA